MSPSDILVLVFAVCGTALLIHYRKKLQELIELLDDELRGPPGPTPLPSNDGHLLRRRARKRETQ
jgi:hypothetical protein